MITCQNKSFNTILILLSYLNILDAVFTIIFVEQKITYELNPFMDYFLSISPLLFLFVKFLIGAIAVLLGFIFEYKRIVRLCIYLCFSIYILVCGLHFFILVNELSF